MYDRIILKELQNQIPSLSQINGKRLKQNRHEKTIASNCLYYGPDYPHFIPFGISK